MAGMLDNPDAAYAKLREMGKGLFGPDGAGLGNILGSLGSNLGGLGGTTAPGGGNAAGNANPQTQQPGQNNLLGGPLGEALGNLIQQGLSNGAGNGTGDRHCRWWHRPQPQPAGSAIHAGAAGLACISRPAGSAGCAAGQSADERRDAAAL